MADVNTPEWIEERKRILAASTDRMELESAATQLATADDPAAQQRGQRGDRRRRGTGNGRT